MCVNYFYYTGSVCIESSSVVSQTRTTLQQPVRVMPLSWGPAD